MAFSSLLAPIAGRVVDRVLDLIPNTAERDAAKHKIEMELLEFEQAARRDQIEINKVEASHPNLLVAGWRPAAGWVSVAGLAYACVLEPFMRFTATMLGYLGEFPELDTFTLVTLLGSMLGIGTLRSADKRSKVDTKQINK